jgi:addiction module RelB/DinJ family antitoxin
MEQCFIQVRVDEKLKKEANDILECMGLDMPNAIRMFLKRIVMERGLPFDAKLPDMPKDETKNIVYIPTLPCKEIDYSEYIEILKRVPVGKITRYDDITKYLAKKYNVPRVEIVGQRPLQAAFNKEYPYWRVVTARGFLCEDRFLHTVEEQKVLLEAEGHTVISGGARGKSLKVENYTSVLYDFDKED